MSSRKPAGTGASVRSADQATIHVEFFGVPRIHAGVAETHLDLREPTMMLGEVLRALTDRFPTFGRECVSFEDENCLKLQRSLTANIDGRSFVYDCRTEVRPGQSLLIMSADNGG